MSVNENYSSGDPQDIGALDWYEYRFNEIDEDDLFWMEKVNNNESFRKLTETTALRITTQETNPVKSGQLVYVKDW